MLVRISVTSDIVGDLDIARHVNSPTITGGRSDVVACMEIEKGLLVQTLIDISHQIVNNDRAC